MANRRIAKNKPLADRAARAESRNSYRPTIREAAQLIGGYKFPIDYPLADAIHVAAMIYESAGHIMRHNVTNKELRDTLDVIEQRSEAICDAIETMAPRVRLSLDDSGIGFRELETIKRKVQRLKWAAHASGKRVSGRSTRSESTNRINFVIHLANVWEDGRKSKPKAGRAADQIALKGSFREFVEKCASLCGVDLTDWGSSYAVVHEALSRRDKMKKKQNRSENGT